MFRCEGSSNIITDADNDVYSTSNDEPLKGTITGKGRLKNPKRDDTQLNCYFTYDPTDYVYFNEISHLLGIPPTSSLVDSFQPYFPFDEDKNYVTCNRKLNIQCKSLYLIENPIKLISHTFFYIDGPVDVEIKPNSTENSTITCTFTGHFKEYLYTNWTVSFFIKFFMEYPSFSFYL